MLGILYRNILKPILFLFPADDVHTFFLKTGRLFGKLKFIKWITRKTLSYNNSILTQKVAGITFKNPIGLAAGFDYDADLIGILPSIGFGFHTIGTVTYLPYAGNPSPMLGRLPKSRSLLVNKGFKSAGLESVLNKINHQNKKIPLGISIGSTNQTYTTITSMIDDIACSFKKVTADNYFDYFEINISCPNLINVANLPEKLDTPTGLAKLLDNLESISFNRPVFIKMYLEKSIEETESLVEVASHYSYITGFIFSNLAKDRSNPAFDQEEIKIAGRGNFSGKPTERMSNNLISAIYKKYKDRFIIVGCGGVFTGKDAYEKIKRGASLVQMVTGMVYQGPSQIGVINKELAYLLHKDGYKNIHEAIGTYKE